MGWLGEGIRGCGYSGAREPEGAGVGRFAGAEAHEFGSSHAELPPPPNPRPLPPLLTNDATVFGLLVVTLAVVFWAERRYPRVFRVVPALLLCYFVPALLNWPLGLIADHWYDPALAPALAEAGLALAPGLTYAEVREAIAAAGLDVGAFAAYERGSGLYFVASRYLLPAALVLLCLSIDLRAVVNLGPKALAMFATATLGIVAGGPIALAAATSLFPGTFDVGPDELWRGLATIAGSWIGGGANQTAMAEIYGVGDGLFASMIVVDIVVANLWLAFLLYGAGAAERVDRWLRADASAIDDLRRRVSAYQASVMRIPSATDTFALLGVAFGGVALAHAGADAIAPWMAGFGDGLRAAGLHSLLSGFFWLVVIATTLGVAASFTGLRRLEGVGASRWGSVFIYVLVATIGMKMDVGRALANPGLFGLGLIWMLVHVTLLLAVAKLIRAPLFFAAVGSQANVGGAASAPVVASAFSPALAPVGVLLAVLGYAVGTYGAILCATLMRAVGGGG